MKRITLLIIAIIAMISCNGQPQPSNDIPEMEYGYEEEINTISFSFDGVIDMLYSPEDNSYFIEYMDVDAMDFSDEDYDYITITMTKELFFELLDDFNKSLDEQLNIEISNKWRIQYIEDPSKPPFYRFKLIKNDKK